MTPASSVGSKKYGPRSGRALPPASTSAPLADGVGDVALDLGELVGADQRAHVLEEGQARAEPHGAQRLREPRREHVVHGGVHVHALDADAELPAVGGDAAHGAGHGAPQAGVGQHQQGVLAAELHRAVLEPLGGQRRDLAAGRRRAGEHEVVGAVDERLAELGAAPGDDLQESAREPRLFEQPRGPQRRERRQGVGLDDHAVAGHERRDGVADGERERVVPRGDDADHAARVMVLPRLGEHRQRALAAARPQEGRRRVRVVARLDGDVEHLLEGVAARLAGLELDDVEDLGGVVDDEVVEAQHDGGALGERAPRPLLLRLARRRAGGGHVGGRALRHAARAPRR